MSRELSFYFSNILTSYRDYVTRTGYHFVIKSMAGQRRDDIGRGRDRKTCALALPFQGASFQEGTGAQGMSGYVPGPQGKGSCLLAGHLKHRSPKWEQTGVRRVYFCFVF